MSDQAPAVDPETALLNALGPDEETPEPEEITAAAEPEAEAPAEETAEAEPERFRVTVKNENGEDEERDLTLEELAKGQMLHADYTRKRQEDTSHIRNLEAQYARDLQAQQSEAVERISLLQELVLQQAAPELNGVDWVSLSVQDPAQFVRLQARQQQVNQTLQALEQQKTQHQQAQEQHLTTLVDQVFKQSEEILSKAIPDLDGNKIGALLSDVQKAVGWTGEDLKAAAKAIARSGMHPDTLGKVLVAVHKASQYDKLQADKPAALKKVAQAPRVIKPAAMPTKSPNRVAVSKLQKSGRMEDLAALL